MDNRDATPKYSSRQRVHAGRQSDLAYSSFPLRPPRLCDGFFFAVTSPGVSHAETDGLLLPGRLRHQRPQGRNDGLQFLVVGTDSGFKLGELIVDELMCGNGFSQLDECPHDENAHLDGARTIEDVGGHDRPMLGKDMG
jgi:hypothetical protein